MTPLLQRLKREWQYQGVIFWVTARAKISVVRSQTEFRVLLQKVMTVQACPWVMASHLQATYSLVKTIRKNWRHGSDGTAFQPHCRFCFGSISVAVRIFGDSLHFLFIAPHARGPSIWLAFFSHHARLARASSSAGFLESCAFLFACLEVCHRAQELHWCLVCSWRSLLPVQLETPWDELAE